MLMQSIRDRAQSWIAWVIIALLIIAFAVWGIDAYFEPEANVTVARVDDVKISEAEFQRAYEMQRAQLQQQFGGNIDPQMFEALGLKQQVLDRLIADEVRLQQALDDGYRVSDVQLAQHINQIQAFQKDGKFDAEVYRQVLSRVSLKPDDWEAQQRRALLLEQPMQGVMTSAFVTQQEVAHMLRVRDQKRELAYAVLPLAAVEKSIEVTDDDARKEFDARRDQYMNPEQIKVDYVELSLDEMAKSIAVDDAALKERYEQHKAQYTTEERRKASHVLIQLAGDAKPEDVEKAKAKAQEVLSKARAGEPFEKLAETYSDDPGSAKQGGDLGFFGRGVMDKAFEDAAFALEKGAVSDVVRSGFGFHIIKLTDIEAQKIKPFEEVRAQIEQEAKHGDAEGKFYEQLDQLETLAFEQPDNLKTITERLQLPVKTSAFFGRAGGEGVLRNPKVIKAAFTSEVLAGSNSEVIEVGANHVIVLRVNEHKAATQKEFDQVRDEVIAKLKQERAKAKLSETAQATLKRLQEGGDASALAKDHGGEWKRPGLVGRSEAGVDQAVLKSAFEAAKPADSKPVFGQASLANGDVALFAVYSVQDGAATADKESVKVLQDSQSQARGQAEFAGLVEEWKGKATVTVTPAKTEQN